MADGRNNDNMIPVPTALWSYILKQGGGHDAVYAAFYRTQLEGWVDKGWSWGRISEKATAAGWSDWLRKQSPASFQGAAQPAAKTKAKAKKVASKRTRLSAAEAERLGAAVIADVTTNPGSKVREISQRTGIDKSVLARLLKSLLAVGSIRSKGDKGQRVYGPLGAAKAAVKQDAPAKPEPAAEE